MNRLPIDRFEMRNGEAYLIELLTEESDLELRRQEIDAMSRDEVVSELEGRGFGVYEDEDTAMLKKALYEHDKDEDVS